MAVHSGDATLFIYSFLRSLLLPTDWSGAFIACSFPLGLVLLDRGRSIRFYRRLPFIFSDDVLSKVSES